MSRKEWKKNLLRMRQLAEQGLGRSEKTEVLTDELQLLERQVEQIKKAYKVASEKLSGITVLPGSGDQEKRLKKLPEYIFSNSLTESANNLTQETQESIFGKVFGLCGEAEQGLAKELLQHRLDVNDGVLTPTQALLDKDLPALAKLRKQLKDLTLDWDAAKNRNKSSNQASSKTEYVRDEVEEAELKVEQCKDQFATEMYTFFAREGELCKILLNLVESQAAHHKRCLEVLEKVVPRMKEEIETNATKPVYGNDLCEHLQQSKREIAMVIEECVLALNKNGLNVEGIFRIAPGASKVKKLKSAFDANMIDMDEFEHDVHCISGALKLYLRELPEPLMTYDLYGSWIQAVQKPQEQRLHDLWIVVDKLKQSKIGNYNNLRYLIKFLAKVASHSDVNKMSTINLAIVIAPNLLWPSGEDRGNVHATGLVTTIVELLISSSEWFFPGNIEFPMCPSTNSSPSMGFRRTSSTSDHPTNNEAKSAFLTPKVPNPTSTSSTSLSSSSLSDVLGSECASTYPAYMTLQPTKRTKKGQAPPPPVFNQSDRPTHQRSASTSSTSGISSASTRGENFDFVQTADLDYSIPVHVSGPERPKNPPPVPPLTPSSRIIAPPLPEKQTTAVDAKSFAKDTKLENSRTLNKHYGMFGGTSDLKRSTIATEKPSEKITTERSAAENQELCPKPKLSPESTKLAKVKIPNDEKIEECNLENANKFDKGGACVKLDFKEEDTEALSDPVLSKKPPKPPAKFGESAENKKDSTGSSVGGEHEHQYVVEKRDEFISPARSESHPLPRIAEDKVDDTNYRIEKNNNLGNLNVKKNNLQEIEAYQSSEKSFTESADELFSPASSKHDDDVFSPVTERSSHDSKVEGTFKKENADSCSNDEANDKLTSGFCSNDNDSVTSEDKISIKSTVSGKQIEPVQSLQIFFISNPSSSTKSGASDATENLLTLAKQSHCNNHSVSSSSEGFAVTDSSESSDSDDRSGRKAVKIHEPPLVETRTSLSGSPSKSPSFRSSNGDKVDSGTSSSRPSLSSPGAKVSKVPPPPPPRPVRGSQSSDNPSENITRL